MKKGLSVLLVAAALFGFYGSAVNLNDILACKDYWEEAGEKSTADMNKLEDGLNQLKDNEQAYLDGVDQLAEGEKALADGEAQYAAGQATLAKGEADYAAAPAKLKAGEKQLADGEDSYADLKRLIKGLKTARKHGVETTNKHDTYWHDGFSHTVSNEVLSKMLSGQKTSDSPGLKQAREVIVKTLVGSKDDVALIEGLVGTSGIVDGAKNAKTYKAFDNAMEKAYKAFDDAQKQLEQIIKMATEYSAKIDGMLDPRLATTDTAVPQSVDETTGEIKSTKPFNQCNIAEMKTGIGILGAAIEDGNTKIGQLKQLKSGIQQLEGVIQQIKAAGGDASQYESQLSTLKNQKAAIEAQNEGASLDQIIAGAEAKVQEAQGGKALLETAVAGREGAQQMLAGVIKDYGSKFEVAAAGNKDFKALYGLMQAIAGNAIINPSTGEVVGADEPNQVFYAYVSQLKDGLTKAAVMLNEKLAVVKNSKSSFKDWRAGYKTLADAKDGSGDSDLASRSSGIPFAFNSMLTNKTIKSALKKYDKGLIKELKKYKGDRLKNDDLDAFDDDLVYICQNLIPRSLKVLGKVKASATKQLAAGRKQLAQGRRDYKAAPGKLADGRAQLAAAAKQLEDGRAQLAAGKEQLAQYEDGEQQVRDGLATLVGTEADLDLESILDRLNGDSDFDNGDEHLDLDEGLAAVEVGRGYQAEDGELITKEIMTRAIGTGGLLAAGVLAVLAALLSFAKKNKGAGISAILSAVAGAFGAFEASQAGTYFSNIAGSTVGQTGMIAAGILACVALVHAIAHFTAKKEA